LRLKASNTSILKTELSPVISPQLQLSLSTSTPCAQRYPAVAGSFPGTLLPSRSPRRVVCYVGASCRRMPRRGNSPPLALIVQAVTSSGHGENAVRGRPPQTVSGSVGQHNGRVAPRRPASHPYHHARHRTVRHRKRRCISPRLCTYKRSIRGLFVQLAVCTKTSAAAE
jgi:hypothetical protein